jgi:hypothetical protein
MGRWGYVQVQHTELWRPILTTTEPSLADELLTELKKMIPSAWIAYRSDRYEKLGIRKTTFDHLEGLDREVGLWIFAKLCELGWEPLGWLGGLGNSGNTMGRRRRIRRPSEHHPSGVAARASARLGGLPAETNSSSI